MGHVNREAARQYKERIKNIVQVECDPLTRFQHTTKRRICGFMWAGVRFIMAKACGGKQLRKSGQGS